MPNPARSEPADAPYDYELARRAIRDLEQLPQGVATACAEFIAGPLAENPYRVGGPLGAPLAGYRSARRGTYRVIYAVDDEQRLIRVTHIDHRRRVYGG